MRRSDREITSFSQLIEIIKNCEVCRLGFVDGEVSYILPLNYGYTTDGEKVTLYFHSATEGKKVDLINNTKTIAFEMDYNHALSSDESKGYCSYVYKSIFGKGKLSVIDDYDEKLSALNTICLHYHPEGFKFGLDAVKRTLVYKVEITEMTGKEKKAKRN